MSGSYGIAPGAAKGKKQCIRQRVHFFFQSGISSKGPSFLAAGLCGWTEKGEKQKRPLGENKRS